MGFFHSSSTTKQNVLFSFCAALGWGKVKLECTVNGLLSNMWLRSLFQYVCVCFFLSSEDGRIRRRNSLSSLPMNDSESERPRSPFPIPSPVPLGHGRSQSSSSLHERDRGLPNGELAMRCKTLITLIDVVTVLYEVENLEFTVDVSFVG